jgi:TRAP-type uncharacterized transport system fused permease subunit
LCSLFWKYPDKPSGCSPDNCHDFHTVRVGRSHIATYHKAHKGYDISYITSYVAWTSEGIFGTPIGAATSFVVLYIIFGECWTSSGQGNFFIDIAYALTEECAAGRRSASVVSSALMGSINGSAVANVVTTGLLPFLL